MFGPNIYRRILYRLKTHGLPFMIIFTMVFVTIFIGNQQRILSTTSNSLSNMKIKLNYSEDNKRPQIFKNLQEIKFYGITHCHCRRATTTGNRVLTEESTCSEFATSRGKKQKVFSYSYYNPHKQDERHNNRYLKPIYQRATEIHKYFPGWLMRLYHNISTEDIEGYKALCSIFCNHSHVDICDVRNLPTIGNLIAKHPIGRVWRFAVMGDPTVSIFNSRDTDSIISEREVMAIRDWLHSTKTFHVMRDFPYHKAVMLAGLWGAKNENRLKDLAKYRGEMFSQPANYNIKFDQTLLKNFVWPNIRNDVMQHDSYTCQMDSHADSIPFPTKRSNSIYVGWGPTKINELRIIKRTHCRVECRPFDHKDWVHC